MQNKRGSVWHRWDPHIHTPYTALNNQYKGADAWESFLGAVEVSDPPIRALGITDYFGIERYEQVVEHKRQGRLSDVGLIFPNVELRLDIETAKASAVNIHLLFSPDDPNHVNEINHFLLELDFSYLGGNFRCQRSDLIRLGRAHQPNLEDDEPALSAGANQFKVNFDQLTTAWAKNEWVKKNGLIAIAGGQKDGTSGLRDATASFAARRKQVERFANVVFTSSPQQIDFWLGKSSASIAELESQYCGPKPCLHGSDAHDAMKVGQPDANRFCWIKGDLTFEALRQVCIEPSERVWIGDKPPRGALEGHTIKSISVTNAPWISQSTIDLNAGLVAVIGARGSGKTALADLIAAGGLAFSPRSNKGSFIYRAKEYLGESTAELKWASGEKTSISLNQTDMEEMLDSPHVQYLSQQFVEQLCSAEGLAGDLVKEIERVIFNAHEFNARLGTDSFAELLDARLEASRQKRERQQQALTRASAELTEERVKKDGLKALEKDRDEKKRAIEKDKIDRNSLIAKGNEERAARHEQVSLAVDGKRQLVAKTKRQYQALVQLKNDVFDFRSRQSPNILGDLKALRNESGLNDSEWDFFKVDYVGPVDLLLDEHIKQIQIQIEELQGPSKTDPPVSQNSDPTISLISQQASLSNQTLTLLERELTRLGNLVGVDAMNAKRFTTLSEKIIKAESALIKVIQLIERANNAEERIRVLSGARRAAYAEVFEAIIEEERELTALYEPIKERINQSDGSLSKLSFSVRRIVNIEQWARAGEELLDLRTNGPFRGRGELLRSAQMGLLAAWETGSAADAAIALVEFAKTNEAALRQHMPEGADIRTWARRVSDWLYSTKHIRVGYGLQYDGANIEQLSPGTRGIVLLLLYLAIDAEDDRPLIIDQPEENLDPQSIFQELVYRFRDAKKRRQIIIVTHNANLVVNTDADQVIVASCGPQRPGQLPLITYESGSLENSSIRKDVCDILEGGERAFKERARRLRVGI
jgi:ABC-type lipoprotein export system ATPase subunit